MFHPQNGARFIAWQSKTVNRNEVKPLVSRSYYLKYFAEVPEDEFEFIPENEGRVEKCMLLR